MRPYSANATVVEHVKHSTSSNRSDTPNLQRRPSPSIELHRGTGNMVSQVCDRTARPIGLTLRISCGGEMHVNVSKGHLQACLHTYPVILQETIDRIPRRLITQYANDQHCTYIVCCNDWLVRRLSPPGPWPLSPSTLPLRCQHLPRRSRLHDTNPNPATKVFGGTS